MGSKRKMGRVFGAVALAATILAGPLGLGQAHAADVESFSGMGTGYALRVSLDLRPLVTAVPALGTVLQTVVNTVPGASMDVPGVIDQYFIRTTSDTSGAVNKARSSVAEGLVDLDVVEATSIGQVVEKTSLPIALPHESLPLIKGNLGILRAAVNKAADVDGRGVMNELAVQLPLPELDNLLSDLDLGKLVDELTGAVTDLVGEGTLENGGALGDLLEGVIGSNPAESSLVGGLAETISGITDTSVLGGLGLPGFANADEVAAASPEQIAASLDDIINVEDLLEMLNGKLDSLLEGDLASLTDLVNTTNALQVVNDGTAVAKSASSLASLDVLDGLLDVSVFNLSSESRAAGVPGSAKNLSSCSLADVKLGDGALGISLDGTNVFINGTPVPVAGELVGTVKGLVDGVLNTLGIGISLCDVAQKSADPDGTAAAQAVSALRIKLAPLGLFELIIDPTVETAVAAQVGNPKVSTQPAPNLPKTGAPIVATILSGIAVAGGALILRRRFF